ncbi:MAG: response regulator transcription factor [Chloroflexi bacterium]|nr:response regulator transcription factor [Chloroflexota bacterium]
MAKLLAAWCSVAGGNPCGTCFPPPSATGCLADFNSTATVGILDLLTLRERQVLRMIAKGMSRTAIAEQLCRSPMTVDNHRKSIMRKLGIQDRVELARYAIAEGIVEV